MTVCIAAACEQGKYVVTASDGLLSYAGITADVLAGKIFWFGNWQFLWAGTPSQVELILEELRKIHAKEGDDALPRGNIQESVRKSFDSFVARESSRYSLAPLGMTIDKFTSEGLRLLGTETFIRLNAEIAYAAQSIVNELIVVGWGDTDSACMIFSVTSQTEGSYALAPVATIGSGGQVALSTLLLLGQARNSTLPDTLYAVAAAKFSSELSEGQGVGEKTLIHISWKRSEKDSVDQTVGTVLQHGDVLQLRTLWEEHGRPKIPSAASPITTPIASRTGSISSAAMFKRVQASLGEAHVAK